MGFRVLGGLGARVRVRAFGGSFLGAGFRGVGLLEVGFGGAAFVGLESGLGLGFGLGFVGVESGGSSSDDDDDVDGVW